VPGHWYLALIYNPAYILQCEPSTKPQDHCWIFVLNSLSSPTRQETDFHLLENYLKDMALKLQKGKKFLPARYKNVPVSTQQTLFPDLTVR
jgi:hypothetical protein